MGITPVKRAGGLGSASRAGGLGSASRAGGLGSASRAGGLVLAVAVVALLGAACTATGRSMAPVCSAERFDPLMLVAQSVPTAERIPCIVSYPAGWSLGGVDVRSGRTSFTLESDRAYGSLKVLLEPRCDTTGAMEIRSDELGTVRHDRRVPAKGGFRETRIYSFPGGCVTYRFGFVHEQALVDEASMAVGFITRAQVDDDARRMTDGRVHL